MGSVREVALSACLVVAGLAAAVSGAFSDSAVFDGLMWGLAGGCIGSGSMLLFRRVSSRREPDGGAIKARAVRIARQDERNVALRDRSGRVAYGFNLVLLATLVIVFTLLEAAGESTEGLDISMVLGAVLLVQVVVGTLVYRRMQRAF